MAWVNRRERPSGVFWFGFLPLSLGFVASCLSSVALVSPGTPHGHPEFGIAFAAGIALGVVVSPAWIAVAYALLFYELWKAGRLPKG